MTDPMVDALIEYFTEMGKTAALGILDTLKPAEEKKTTFDAADKDERIEYGYQLLAAQAEAEGLREELRLMTVERDQAVIARTKALEWSDRYGKTLQRVHKGFQMIEDALRYPS